MDFILRNKLFLHLLSASDIHSLSLINKENYSLYHQEVCRQFKLCFTRLIGFDPPDISHAFFLGDVVSEAFLNQNTIKKYVSIKTNTCASTCRKLSPFVNFNGAITDEFDEDYAIVKGIVDNRIIYISNCNGELYPGYKGEYSFDGRILSKNTI